MNFGKTEETAALILERFPKLELKLSEDSELQNQIEIPADQLVIVCGYLYKEPKLYFDFFLKFGIFALSLNFSRS